MSCLLHPLSLGIGLSPRSLMASCSGESPCPLHGFAPAYLRCFHGKAGMGYTEESAPGQKNEGLRLHIGGTRRQNQFPQSPQHLRVWSPSHDCHISCHPALAAPWQEVVMGTTRPIRLLRRPYTGQDASPVQAGLAPAPAAPPAAAAWPSTAHAARLSRGGPWPRASRCRQVMVFPGRHPRRGQARVPAPRWEGTSLLPAPRPGPRSRSRPPRRGPWAPASRQDGTGRDRTGWDGAAGAVQASPVRRQHGPELCGGSAAGGAPGEGSLPSSPGGPDAGPASAPTETEPRPQAQLPGRAGPQPTLPPHPCGQGQHPALISPCFPPARAGLRQAPEHPTGCQTCTPHGRTPAPAWRGEDLAGCKSPPGPLTGTGALSRVRIRPIHVRTCLTPSRHICPPPGG